MPACHRKIRILAGIAVLSIALVQGAAAARSQEFQTGPISVCTNEIEDKTDPCRQLPPPFGNLSSQSFPNGRIDFKLVLIGQQEALSYLKQHGYLPVRIGVWKDGLRKDDDIAIDINQSDWHRNRAKIISEAADEGQFTWRTFFYVDLDGAKSVSIEIDDGQGVTALSGANPARLSLSFAN